ncbi:hypothetical protein [Aeoliella mucimassa]|uniref:PEP-CTERM protein-sorting domain-containing protein n=1 Tax=Aeoliella mucimassa TaxID=2527972 RepID=A0A518ATR4_9BACT|nr:hypothetical protein [Aeoliella mucimassa]QDU58097.1 hypothetical protein Pan181_43230 [Aeoliella mucimassa]
MTRTTILSLASMLLVFGATAAQAAIIETESNNTLATADVIDLAGATADAGVVNLTAGDVDVFSIDLEVGDFLGVNTYGVGSVPPGDSPNTVVGLFDSAGELLLLDDDGGQALGSNFTYLSSTADSFYIAVTGYPDGQAAPLGSTFGAAGVFDGSHTAAGPYLFTVSVLPQQVPEPASCLLVAGGLLALLAYRKR